MSTKRQRSQARQDYRTAYRFVRVNNFLVPTVMQRWYEIVGALSIVATVNAHRSYQALDHEPPSFQDRLRAHIQRREAKREAQRAARREFTGEFNCFMMLG